MNLQLIKQDKFNNILVDVYRNDNDEVFMTSKQLGEALEYSNPIIAINKLVSRNTRLQNERFSVVTTLVSTDGKKYQTRIFTEYGIYEVTMLSKQPKASAFRDFTQDMLVGLRKGELQITQKPSYQIDDPIERAKRWIEEEEQRQRLQIENEEMKPKALFAVAVETSYTSILIGELAKLIKQNGVDIGQNRLYEWLRQNNYIIKRRGELYNTPTQKSMDAGLFEVKVRTLVNPDGTVRITRTTKVTGKGQIYFVNKFIGNDKEG